MSQKLKLGLQYFVSLGLAGILLYFVFKDIPLSDVWSQLLTIDARWIYLSNGIYLLSLIARAYRWTLLFEPLEIKVTTWRAFIALLIGYGANLIVPRMGEVSRCGVLTKTDNTPFSSAIGTVIVERVIDMLCLLVVVISIAFLELEKLSTLLRTMFYSTMEVFEKINFSVLIALGVLGFLAFILLWRIVKKSDNTFLKKVTELFSGILKGMSSVMKMDKKILFWSSTGIIWLCYFFMTYVIFFALPSTQNLSLLAGLSVLAMGGIGMALPVQGGFGSYHALVSATLLLYGISAHDGVIFATLVHTTQVVVTSVLAAICLVLSFWIQQKNAKQG